MSAPTDNPWYCLPTHEPYVLDCDKTEVLSYNERARNDNYKIHTDLLPEPFLGHPDASVVLLNLNPGYSNEDHLLHGQSGFISSSRCNIIHADLEYPFYLLDPKNDGPGQRWWLKKFKPLIDWYDLKKVDGLRKVAKSFFCVEWFPYHTAKFAHDKLAIQSQQYSFKLVRKAIARGALIIVMRSEKRWCQAVPELQGYRNKYKLRSVQNPVISLANCPDGFPCIISRLERVGLGIE